MWGPRTHEQNREINVIESTAGPYQVMPPLSDDEYAALRADISERGVLVAVVLDQHGHILDGHHRAAIATDLGIDYPTEVRTVASEVEARDVAFALNMARRQLTREQRRTMIVVELRHDPTRSDRAIGRQLGVDGKTVGAVRAELDEAKQARAQELAAEQAEQQASEMAALRAMVKTASPTELRRLTAWIWQHRPDLADNMANGIRGLSDTVVMVVQATGCALDCEHMADCKIGSDLVTTAEFPHPVPPLGTLGRYRVHPIADLFPIPEDTLQELTADVERHGLIMPIILTHDRTTLVDGRIRYLACQAAGIEPTYVTLSPDLTEEQIMSRILAENCLRMVLTQDQRFAIEAIGRAGDEHETA